MLPGPLSAQDTVPVASTSALVKLTGEPPATTVLVVGETDREGFGDGFGLGFPASGFPLEPPQPRRRHSSDADVSHRAFDMSDSLVDAIRWSDAAHPFECSGVRLLVRRGSTPGARRAPIIRWPETPRAPAINLRRLR